MALFIQLTVTTKPIDKVANIRHINMEHISNITPTADGYTILRHMDQKTSYHVTETALQIQEAMRHALWMTTENAEKARLTAQHY